MINLWIVHITGRKPCRSDISTKPFLMQLLYSNNMKHNLALLLILLAAASILFGVVNYKRGKNYLDTKVFLEKIRTDNKAGFDSLQQAINYENNLNFRIQKAIADSNSITAYALIDSLPTFGRLENTLLYQGNILEKKGDYLNALKKYDSVIGIDKYSIAIDDKARVLIKVNKVKEAINTYKIPFEWGNYDNALHIAKTFELMQQKDSTLNYYKIYLHHYPNDLAVKKMMLLIEKSK